METNISERILQNFGGMNNNNLINIIDNADTDNSEPNVVKMSYYYDPSTMKNAVSAMKDKFSILSLNIQSLNAKFNNLIIFLKQLESMDFHFSCVCLQETWLSDNIDLSTYQITNYNLISQSKICSGHGGLAIYLHDDYKYKLKNLYTTSDIWEGQFIEVSGDQINKKIIIGNIYKPPKDNTVENINTFIDEIRPIVNTLERFKSDVVLAGDFNLNLLKVPDNNHISDYFETLISSGFIPKITLPTRFTDTSATLIDNIFCKFSTSSTDTISGIYLTNISDHLPYFTSIHCKPPQPRPPKFVTKRLNNKTATENFINELSNMNLLSKLDDHIDGDPNENYNLLERYILQAKEKHFPLINVKFNKYKHPLAKWLTPGILKSFLYRDNLYRNLKLLNPLTDEFLTAKINLSTYCKILNKCKREAMQNYYDKQFIKFKNNMKETWKTIKYALNSGTNCTPFPAFFILDGKLIQDRYDIANAFNNFFTSIGPDLAKTIVTPLDKSYKDYLNGSHDLDFEFTTVDSCSVGKIIKELKSKASSGHDGISTILLKEASDVLTDCITLIINQCINTGIFPNQLKIAKVLPLYKKDNEMLLTNYRPISLLPAISKVLERIMFNQLYDFFQNNNLFYASQYGFRKKHSTEMAALELVDRIIHEIDTGNIPIAFFIDLSKAFDTLDHTILQHKLEYYGIRNLALKLLSNYLDNRQQFVEIEGKKSEQNRIITGVPQGSILGPLLFIIYMNDINNASNIFNAILFADDTSLQSTLNCFNVPENQSSEQINIELQNIFDWLSLNKLSLNANKTKCMKFHTAKNKKAENIQLNLKIANTPVECVNEFNFLGITIDMHLSWKPHINKLSCKISKTLGILNRLKNSFPPAIMKTLYSTLVLSHLNYGILCWGFSPGRLVKLQKNAIRTITCSKYNAHTSPLFKSLQVLKLSDIFNIQALKFYYKHCQGELPQFLQSFNFQNRSDIHNYDTRNRTNIVTIKTTLKQTDKCLRNFVPILINQMPNIITSKLATHSLQGFLIYVKNYFITNYEIECTIPACYICR